MKKWAKPVAMVILQLAAVYDHDELDFEGRGGRADGEACQH
jgi:hypothetical protein